MMKPCFKSIDQGISTSRKTDMNGTVDNFLANKHYADLRIKIGAKKLQASNKK
jgi:hypothetical protein